MLDIESTINALISMTRKGLREVSKLARLYCEQRKEALSPVSTICVQSGTRDLFDQRLLRASAIKTDRQQALHDHGTGAGAAAAR